MTNEDELGDRMKDYERRETSRRMFVTLPVYARIDGRGFSKFTEGMDRPYDSRMTQAMIEVTEYLVRETHATIGYVQSDEISLVWRSPDYTTDIFFNGKIQKMASVLASMAAAKMGHVIRGWAPYEDRLPAFDARVLQLPNDTEAANMFLWRTLDAQKNAVSMATRAKYQPEEMHGKDRRAMLEMLFSTGVSFDAYPEAFRLGTFVRRETVVKELTPEDLAKIPEEHRPDTMEFTRSKITRVYPGSFQRITNRTEFIFDGAEAIVAEF